MAQITAAIVKELRERTGAGMMDCKKALVATEGDMEKAIDFLREKDCLRRLKRPAVWRRKAQLHLIFPRMKKSA